MLRPPRYKNGDRGQTYNFSRVFGGDTQQAAFYQATAAPMVRQLTRALQSSVIMAYGISAAGKTHTVEARTNAILEFLHRQTAPLMCQPTSAWQSIVSLNQRQVCSLGA